MNVTTSPAMRWIRTAFFVVVGAALMLEAQGDIQDPFALVGYYFHANVSSWLDCTIKDCTLRFSNIKFIFSILEVCLFIILGLWFFYWRNQRPRPRLSRGTLFVPLMLFLGMLAFGLLWGIARGGDDVVIGLQEVRGPLMLIFAYFLAGIFLTEETYLNRFVNVTLLAGGVLALENILRWLLLYQAQTPPDLGYDHIDSVVLAFTALLCINLILLGGTRAQRLWAGPIIVLIVVAIDVMNRRAAFAVLAVGMVVIVLLIIRLRPQLFWTIVLPCLVVLAFYLVMFWRADGAIGAPARAISSLFEPDTRDAASNVYRTYEWNNILGSIAPYDVRLLGLGFGQPFTFFVMVPGVDFSFWPFWHYTPHNNILWIWLKTGAIGFISFFWLLGRAAYDGSVALDTQRQQWSLVAGLRRLLVRREGRPAAMQAPTPDLPIGFGVTDGQPLPKKDQVYDEAALRWNVPSWQRDASNRNRVEAKPSGVIAMLATCICIIPAQVAFSYVDLGLISERDMLLFGLALGILARAQMPLGVIQAQLRDRLAKRPRNASRTRTPRPASNHTPEPAGTIISD